MFRTIFDLHIDLPTAKYFIKTIVIEFSQHDFLWIHWIQESWQKYKSGIVIRDTSCLVKDILRDSSVKIIF